MVFLSEKLATVLIAVVFLFPLVLATPFRISTGVSSGRKAGPPDWKGSNPTPPEGLPIVVGHPEDEEAQNGHGRPHNRGLPPPDWNRPTNPPTNPPVFGSDED
ncbi:hypothetical protein HGRIS_011014 [Hohenbuehelia grisea]|uniref:Secreted protein n=1 Tax=Hohenbuehelia grisea TaxID=104357 RepID=A0ABR3IYX0_9AGAR